MNPRVIAGPEIEPITLEEVKAQCRIDADTDEENDLLQLYTSAAREYYEGRTGQTLHQKTLEYVLSAFPASRSIILPRATPLIEVLSVKYKDSDGLETTWENAGSPPTYDYIADTDSAPGRLVLAYGASWPSFTAYPVSPIRIQYTAGIATASPATEVGSLAKIPILMLVAGMYEHREPSIVQDKGMVAAVALQYGVEAFIAQNIVTYVF